MTPEGRVKLAIKAILDRYGDDVYVYMPVPSGFGRSTLDYLGICRGLGFAIEAKKRKGKPTLRQEVIIEDITKAQGRVFVINGPDGLIELDNWLRTVCQGD